MYYTGSKLFNDFLTRQLAQENLAFYIAVERWKKLLPFRALFVLCLYKQPISRIYSIAYCIVANTIHPMYFSWSFLPYHISFIRFDSMCKNLSKLYLQLLKMRARALQADNGVITPAPVVSATTSIIPTYDSTQNTQNNSPKSELNTQDENNTMSAELDKPKVFPIKVKPSNNSSSGLTNPASVMYNSHRIAIQELESDEELVAEESVRRNIHRSNKDKPTSPTSIEENTQLLQAIEHNTHKVTKNILELQLVAKHIMETYIFEGTCKQINLPGVMRLRAEKNFQRWTESIASGKLATTVEFKVPLAQTTHSSHENSFTFLSTPQNEPAGDGMSGATGATSDAEVAKRQEVATNATHTPLAINNNSGNTIVPNKNDTNNNNSADPSTDNSANPLPHHPTITNDHSINADVHTNHNTDNNTDSKNCYDEPEAAVQAFVRNFSVQNMQFSTASRTVSRLAPTSVPKELNGNTSPTITENDDEANAPYKTESKPIYRSIFEVPAINPPPYNDEALRRLNSGSSEVGSPMAGSVKVTTAGTPLNATSGKNTTTNNTSNTSNTLNSSNTLNNTSTTPTLVSVEGIDMSFVDLFAESKAEILKLLRDDKFPRWKQTAEFQSFIHNVKPYDKDREHSRYNNNIQSQNSSDKDRSIDSHSYRSKS